MTYCIDFFRKFKKDGNFCGLDKAQVSRLTAYLEIVEMLMKQDIPEEQVYKNFSVRAATPLIAAKGDAHTEGLNYVTKQLKGGKKVQTVDMQSTLNGCTCSTSLPAPKPVKQKKPEPLNAGKLEETPPLPKEKPAKSNAFCYQPGEMPVASDAPVVSLGEMSRQKEQAAEIPPQLPPEAPMSEKIKRDELTLANTMFIPGSQYDPATGGRLIKGPGVVIKPDAVSREQAGKWLTMIVRGYLTKSQQGIWEDIRKSGELGDTDLEIFEGLLDAMGERMQ